MKSFLIFSLLLNAAYFAFVAYLSYRARQRNDPERRGYLLRLPWAEFTTGWVLPAFNVDLAGYFSPRVQIQIYWIYGTLFLKTPITTRYNECYPPSYGFSFTDIDGDGWQQIHWRWGRKTWIWDMPWTLQHYSTAYKTKFDSWLVECRRFAKRLGLPMSVNSWEPEVKALLWRETYPYLYVLRDGTPQHRYATVTISERRWRRKWLPFTDAFGLTSRRIEISFDREVGERTGSWKGGTTGCSYELRPTETPALALARMEAERKFN